MLLGIGFKVILISAVLLGLMVPVRARILAVGGAAPEVPDGPFSKHPVVGLIRPLAQLLDLVTSEPAATAACERRLSNIAVALVFVAPLSAFAVIPFGSRYRLGEQQIDLVVANLDGGIVWLLGAALLALYGSVGLGRDASQRVRLAVVGVSYTLGAALALAAVAMVFGTLNLTAIAVAQDQTFSIDDFFGPALPALQRLQIPGWGMFLQPVSLLLFTVCALGASRATPAESASESESHRSGAQQLLLRVSEQLGGLLVAGIVVALFFGGGALPYLSGDTIIRAIGKYYGTGLATLLCMAIHMGVFFAKVMLVTVAIEPLRRRLVQLSFDRSLNRCWKAIIPLSVVNLFMTAQVLVVNGTP